MASDIRLNSSVAMGVLIVRFSGVPHDASDVSATGHLRSMAGPQLDPPRRRADGFGRRPASTHDVFRLAAQLRVNPKVVARDANSISSPNSNIVGLPAVAM